MRIQTAYRRWLADQSIRLAFYHYSWETIKRQRTRIIERSLVN